MLKVKNCSFLLITIASLLFVNTNKIEAQNNHHHQKEKSTHNHTHKSIELSDNDTIPTIKIIVSPDKVKGWNLEIQSSNFVFKPENINQNSNINEGHGHLYINGEKITRIYSNWYHIPELPKGKNEIKVTLNTNLHEDLMYKGNVIQDVVIIQH
ncbi:hypothetical protein ACN4EE_13160 [Geminocystis sp. CENA526]|uniref:hypothetical protein n=1 Tax=Geminocystis sp. CENA526 TaxID=1355871 RepID=UPI003D6F02BA